MKNNYKKFIYDENYLGNIYATFLLAQFKEKSLFKIFLELIKLPGEIPFDLYGDSITEDTARILGTVYDGEIELKQDKGMVISRCKRDEHNKFITNAIESISWWACFEDENEKSNESW